MEFLNGLSEAFWTWMNSVLEYLPTLRDVDQGTGKAVSGLSINQWLILLIIVCFIGFFFVRGLGSRRKA